MTRQEKEEINKLQDKIHDAIERIEWLEDQETRRNTPYQGPRAIPVEKIRIPVHGHRRKRA